MKMLIVWLALLSAQPARVVCPIDGTVVGFNGRTRQTNKQTECQYQHVWLHYKGSLLIDEPHVLWAPCEVK